VVCITHTLNIFANHKSTLISWCREMRFDTVSAPYLVSHCTFHFTLSHDRELKNRNNQISLATYQEYQSCTFYPRTDITNPDPISLSDLDPYSLHFHLLTRRILRFSRRPHLPRQCGIRIRPPRQTNIPIHDLRRRLQENRRRHSIINILLDVHLVALVEVHVRRHVGAGEEDRDSDVGGVAG
jgi:hypothetical protein